MILKLPLRQPQLHEIGARAQGDVDQVTDPIMWGDPAYLCRLQRPRPVTTAPFSEASGVLLQSRIRAYEHVPFVKVTNLARAMEELREAGFRLVGLDSEAEIALAEVDKTPPLVLVLGAEGKGLRELTRKNCDMVVKLDFSGAIRSLNVSNAAAVALYALIR
jgi:23S rRNA (guanosine2251-2'-O)-methyltransferase